MICKSAFSTRGWEKLFSSFSTGTEFDFGRAMRALVRPSGVARFGACRAGNEAVQIGGLRCATKMADGGRLRVEDPHESRLVSIDHRRVRLSGRSDNVVCLIGSPIDK